MINSGLLEPLPLIRAIRFARAGSLATSVAGMPIGFENFLDVLDDFGFTLPGGSVLSIRTSL